MFHFQILGENGVPLLLDQIVKLLKLWVLVTVSAKILEIVQKVFSLHPLYQRRALAVRASDPLGSLLRRVYPGMILQVGFQLRVLSEVVLNYLVLAEVLSLRPVNQWNHNLRLLLLKQTRRIALHGQFPPLAELVLYLLLDDSLQAAFVGHLSHEQLFIHNVSHHCSLQT